MALLEKLKSLFGVGGDRSNRRDRDGGVTVEAEPTDRTSREAPPPMSSRQRDEPATDVTDGETGRSSVEPVADDSAAEDNKSTDDEGSADEDEAEIASGSVADAIEEAEPERDDEPSVESDEDDGAAAGTDASGSTETISRVPDDGDGAAEPGEAVGPDETDAAPTTEKTTDSKPDVSEVESEPVTEIKGIGPAYAERLGNAGVDSTLALAESDAEELADEADIATSRVEEWIDRANDR